MVLEVSRTSRCICSFSRVNSRFMVTNFLACPQSACPRCMTLRDFLQEVGWINTPTCLALREGA